MQNPQLDQDLAATFESIKKQRPVYTELVDRFQDLFQAQASLAKRFAEHDFGLTPQGADRSGQGVSLLADMAFPQCGEQLDRSRREILPILERSFPLTDGDRSLAELAEAGFLDMNALSDAFMKGDAAVLAQAAEDADIDPQVFVFVVRSVLGPVLAGMARSVAGQLEEQPWSQGYCPFCGSPPAIGSLSRFNNERDEELVGGGGKKRLTCSLCSHEWGFRRDSCPACGNTDQDQRELLWDEENRHERIEACKKCGSYLLCVDLREVDGKPRMEAASLGLVHLDLIAQQHDYTPLAAMPWNLDE